MIVIMKIILLCENDISNIINNVLLLLILLMCMY